MDNCFDVMASEQSGCFIFLGMLRQNSEKLHAPTTGVCCLYLFINFTFISLEFDSLYYNSNRAI